jgi:hypothetical protein
MLDIIDAGMVPKVGGVRKRNEDQEIEQMNGDDFVLAARLWVSYFFALLAVSLWVGMQETWGNIFKLVAASGAFAAIGVINALKAEQARRKRIESTSDRR